MDITTLSAKKDMMSVREREGGVQRRGTKKCMGEKRDFRASLRLDSPPRPSLFPAFLSPIELNMVCYRVALNQIIPGA